MTPPSVTQSGCVMYVKSPWLLPLYSIETVHDCSAKLIIVKQKGGHVSTCDPSHFWARPRLLKLQHWVFWYVSIILYKSYNQQCVFKKICLDFELWTHFSAYSCSNKDNSIRVFGDREASDICEGENIAHPLSHFIKSHCDLLCCKFLPQCLPSSPIL